MAVQGKKINELTAIGTVSDETVLPAVYVSGTTVNSTANKISIEQISTKVQDDMSTALAGKQDTLVSGTNIKTINNESLLGSGNLDVDGLPSQSGQSGKFLTTDGTDASWAQVSIPEGVYTKTNLLAASPIEIVDEMAPEGLDEHTLGCWHFEDNTNNAVSPSTLTDNMDSLNKGFVTTAKFGTYAAWLQTSSLRIYNSTALNSYTIDFWFNKPYSSIYYLAPGADFYLGLWGDGTAHVKKYGAPDSEYVTMSNSATGWHHYAFVRDGANCYCFFDGVLKHTFTASGSATTTMWQDGSGGTTSDYIDELRISDIARWISNFTPATHAYGTLTPTGNSVISLDQDIEGMYTRANLLGGENVTIDELPQPLIDEHTKSLWHFNNNLTNAISGSTAELNSTSFANPTYSESGKFGACVKALGLGFTDASLQYNSYTIETWVKCENGTKATVYAFNAWPKIVFEFSSDNTYVVKVILDGEGSWTEVASGSVSYTAWKHVAVCGSGYNNYIFLNGKLIYTLNDTRTNQDEFGVNTKFNFDNTGSSDTNIYIDEMAGSNVCKWTSDFTPFTKPYSDTVEEAQYTINAKSGIPTDVYDDLTLGVSGATYTMPADGFLTLWMSMLGAYSNMAILNASTGRAQFQYAAGTIDLAITMAVYKGEVMTVYYGATSGANKNYFRFYYAKGSESEQGTQFIELADIKFIKTLKEIY